MKKLLSLLLALALALGLCAPGLAEETVVFTDDAGREVELPAQIERLVPSGPLAQMVLYALAPDLFVGMASDWNADDNLGIIDPDFLALPYFGQLYGSADLNVEQLALADPQVVVDIGEDKPTSTEDMDTLQAQTGVPSVFISATLETRGARRGAGRVPGARVCAHVRDHGAGRRGPRRRAVRARRGGPERAGGGLVSGRAAGHAGQ